MKETSSMQKAYNDTFILTWIYGLESQYLYAKLNKNTKKINWLKQIFRMELKQSVVSPKVLTQGIF